MYDYTIYNALKSKVKVCRLSGSHDECNVRCPFCLDSIKDKSHAHFYIQNKPPFKYYCQRCNAKGVFNIKLLNMFEISSPDLVIAVNNSYTNYQKQLAYKYSTNIEFLKNKEYDYTVKEIYEDYIHKINYLRGRIGMDINDNNINEVLSKYKVILNLSDFIENNKLDMRERFKYDNQKQQLAMLDEKFIGFMSMDKNFISFRNTIDNEPRYTNMRLIIDGTDNNQKIYGISNRLNLASTEFNVHITEGIFDIMGVYNNLYNEVCKENDIFLAANGKSYLLAMNMLLSMGVTNANINIYSDKDVNINFYQELKKQSKLVKLNGATIYYNKAVNEKDFGVTKDRIILSQPINI